MLVDLLALLCGVGVYDRRRAEPKASLDRNTEGVCLDCRDFSSRDCAAGVKEEIVEGVEERTLRRFFEDLDRVVRRASSASAWRAACSRVDSEGRENEDGRFSAVSSTCSCPDMTSGVASTVPQVVIGDEFPGSMSGVIVT